MFPRDFQFAFFCVWLTSRYSTPSPNKTGAKEEKVNLSVAEEKVGAQYGVHSAKITSHSHLNSRPGKFIPFSGLKNVS